MSIKLKGSTDGSVTLQAPADTSPTGTDKTFTLPTQDGDAGQILKTDGSGALSFTDNLASNRNLIINGAMNVAQRGTSSTTNGYGTVDRFSSLFAQASITQSQQTLSSGSPYNEGLRYFFRVAVTSASNSANAYAQIEQRVEAQDLAQSGWNYKSSSSYVTFSFWARSSLAGTYYVGYRNSDASTLQYVASFALTADTWTKVTHTIPGASTVVFNNDNGEGLRIVITPHYGTAYTGSGSTVNTWQTLSGSDYYPDYAQNWTNTASATFDVTGVQLEVGSVATAFEHRSYGDELARCQRYYETTYPSGYSEGHNFNEQYSFPTSHPIAFNFIASDDTTTAQSYTFQVSKRNNPTVRLFSANNGASNQAWTYKATGGNTNAGISVVNTSPTHVLISTQLDAANKANESYFHLVGDAEL